MTTKIKASKIRYIFVLGTGVVFFWLAQSILAAENPIPLDQNNVSIDSAHGLTPDDILSSIDRGGLATPQNIDTIKDSQNTEPAADVLPIPNEDSPAPDQPPPAPNVNSLKHLESQGGLSFKPQNDSEDDTLFKTVTKFLERVVFRSNVEFTKTPEFDEGMNISGTPTFDKDTAGYAVIKKGNQSVDVEFEQEYETPPIVTASLSLQQYDDLEVKAAAEDLLLVSDVKFIVTKTTKNGFEIMMDHIADSDIPFSWHALSVKDPETSYKKGATLKNATPTFRYPDSYPSN